MSSRSVFAGTALALAGCLAALPAAGADSYPSRPVRLIVPYAPGGPVDVIGRLVAKTLGEAVGQNVYVDNRPGGSGTVGTLAAIHSPPDGYTLLVGSTATISILPSMKADVGYDPQRDLVPISVVATGVHIFAVHPKVPVDDMPGFIRYAKAQSVPLAAAAGGAGTPDDLALYLLEKEADISLAHVPYKGTGPAIADVVAGHVPVVAADVSALLPFLEAGRLKPLGIAALQRNPLVPTVPTAHEQGLKGFESGGWFGVFAPAGTPAAVVETLSTKLAAKMAQPEVQERLRAAGVLPVGTDASTARERVRKETEKWRTLIRNANLRIE
ncbi:MAG: tripartite tricarboxylate transporter substrate binding protein [Pigmentiphaga sp.]|uniref:Bug family tripartite tricarboxylate transporter substrate binding protein n=1 Tax=Pigmentiphaga sp. TaxID=1977564 RepID=UPI0029B34B84|nr:tripartite tricarboxylate transporter substrate binding protein [Pigmentiphaga sp.]MDX3906685.1 tripartite tricarboxylate transporter substrate binding protein [Pigmentiphaga sp.]